MWYTPFITGVIFVEAEMVLSIKESREFVLFRAFADSSSFDESLNAIEAYDAANPQGRILASGDDKFFLFESYKLFREAEKTLISKEGQRPDYGNEQQLERLKTVLSQRLPAVSREVLLANATGISLSMANIGRMLAVHARNLKIIGRKDLAEQKKQAAKEDRRQMALTERQGRVDHGAYGGGSVFSTKSGDYKSIGQILKERIIAEENS